MKRVKFTLVLGAWLITAPAQAEQAATPAPPTAPKVADVNTPADVRISELVIKPTDHVLGKKQAKVTIFEYASLSCTHCADFYVKTMPRLKEAYIDKGKVNLVYRDYPLNEPALRAAQITSCIGAKQGDEAYFRMLKALFASQSGWVNDSFMKPLENIARLGGMPPADFKACLENKEIEQAVLENRKNGSLLGVKSTPTFFIGTTKMEGTKTFEEFIAVIDPLLK